MWGRGISEGDGDDDQKGYLVSEKHFRTRARASAAISSLTLKTKTGLWLAEWARCAAQETSGPDVGPAHF